MTNSSIAAYTDVKAVAATTTTNLVADASGKVYTPKSPETFTYDADGNLTQDGRWSYTWDGENRLIAMEGASGVPAAAKKKMEFVYDYYGRRIQRKIYVWNSGGSTYDLSTTTRYIYDNWNCIAEVNGGGTLLRDYAWGLDLSGSMYGAGGVGGLLMMDNVSNASSHYYRYDGNGNVVGLTDASTGASSADYEYGAFGEIVRIAGTMKLMNDYQFSTKIADADTGFLYYGYRFYDPNKGRWLNRDPLEEHGGIAVNEFVNNDAVNSIDLLGYKKLTLNYDFNSKEVSTLEELFHQPSDVVYIFNKENLLEDAIKKLENLILKGKIVIVLKQLESLRMEQVPEY